MTITGVVETDRSIKLMRAFCQDWLNRADGSACTAIMVPDYEVSIGGIVLSGLAEYVPATLGQLTDFAGLQITVHELFSNGDQIALRFTEHGASLKAGGNSAAWRGIALFWTDGTLLLRNVTEEDYTSRRSQLSSGVSNVVDSPAVAPWSTAVLSPVASAEAAVRSWLKEGGLTGPAVVFDDGSDHASILDVDSTAIVELFSAGEQVAFRVIQTGSYSSGLGLADSAVGAPAQLSVVGMVRVHPDGTVTGHAIRDRAGLRRALSRS